MLNRVIFPIGLVSLPFNSNSIITSIHASRFISVILSGGTRREVATVKAANSNCHYNLWKNLQLFVATSRDIGLHYQSATYFAPRVSSVKELSRYFCSKRPPLVAFRTSSVSIRPKQPYVVILFVKWIDLEPVLIDMKGLCIYTKSRCGAACTQTNDIDY